ncbi:hypothetical protein C8J56DRAFT_1031512 [Mycena floridula]|nr:hypothetical protein C8J56DRAFT_1031512 [Mycena floridula]
MSASGSPTQTDTQQTAPIPVSSPPRAISPPLSRSTLASALSESYKEIEALKTSLAEAQRRADHFEQVVNSFHASSDAERAVQEVRSWEKRAREAELARDDELARRVVIRDLWQNTKDYLRMVDECAQEARRSFDVALDRDGGELILKSMPPPVGDMELTTRHYSMKSGRLSGSSRASTALFPIPQLPPLPASNRRPRGESLDGYGVQPPAKRSRYTQSHLSLDPNGPYPGYHDVAPGQHAILTRSPSFAINQISPQSRHRSRNRDHGHRSSRHRSRSPNHHHSRSLSRSSNDSLDVDEMLLQTTGESNGAPPGQQVPQHHQAQQPTYHRERKHSSATPYIVDKEGGYYDANQIEQQRAYHNAHQHQVRKSQREHNRYPGESMQQIPVMVGAAGPGPTGGTLQSYQTHVFAPVVTGAPVKKGKFSANVDAGGDSAGLINPTAPASGNTFYPATNEVGQRICRQCGMPGRYKEGKCVEKWGPGPMGPGTVCDRCRKKMKRVERRGTLDAAAQQSQTRMNSSVLLPATPASHTQLSNSSSMRDVVDTSRQQPIRRADTLPISPVSHRALGPTGTHINIDMLPNSGTGPEESAMRTGLGPATVPAKPGNGHSSRMIEPPSRDSPAAANVSHIDTNSRPPSRDFDNGNVLSESPTALKTSTSDARASDRERSGSGSAASAPGSLQMDVDADADADADEEAASATVDGNREDEDVDMLQSPVVPKKKATGEADPELDLYDAVSAAEANSVRSRSSGMKSD